jgi:hypothetical protein
VGLKRRNLNHGKDPAIHDPADQKTETEGLLIDSAKDGVWFLHPGQDPPQANLLKRPSLPVKIHFDHLPAALCKSY